MDGWTSMQSSSKDLHEAIKQSLNGILYSNTQGKKSINNKVIFFRYILAAIMQENIALS